MCAAGSGRIVRAVEPLPSNVAHILRRTQQLRRDCSAHGWGCGGSGAVRAYAAALSDRARKTSVDGRLKQLKLHPAPVEGSARKLARNDTSAVARGAVEVDVRRLDDMYAEWTAAEGGEPRLGFAHLDVEGSELGRTWRTPTPCTFH